MNISAVQTLFGKDAMGRNCGGAMSKTFGKFKFRISYADDGDDVHVYGCDMTRVKVDVVSCDRPKNPKYDQSGVLITYEAKMAF